ncbi:hydroxyproline dehydrogenase-like [Anas platyrhynchos]|uniref:hydroxyproline dehydrogenase-like n=1 Tax=Anas platyrhynchos TaxID=8839 RepID=UPI003AF2FD6C
MGRPTAPHGPLPPKRPLDFGGGAALGGRSSWELVRALLVLRLCAVPAVGQHAETVLRVSRRVLGGRVWGWALRGSVYGHFVGGDSPRQLQATAQRLRDLGLRPLLALPSEDEGQHRRYGAAMGRCGSLWGLYGSLWVTMGRCGAVMGPYGSLWVSVGPYGSVMGQPWVAVGRGVPQGAGLEANARAALSGVGLAAGTGPRPMMQLKVTALMSARLCAPSFSCLSPDDNAQLGAALRRLDGVAACPHPPSICVPAPHAWVSPYGSPSYLWVSRYGSAPHVWVCPPLMGPPAAAVSRGVRVLLDAEQSELRAALTLLGLALMARHNRGTAWVWHTQQAYLRDAVQDLQRVLSRGRRLGVAVGLKLVRGAYLQHERGRGTAMDTPQHTDRSYAQCLELALTHGGGLELMVATHNEGSVQLAARRMEELGVPRDGPVCFGQLLGMGDHISLALGRAGFLAYKSVPFGPPEAALPYLARRAQENRALLEGGSRERELLARELRRRLLPWASPEGEPGGIWGKIGRNRGRGRGGGEPRPTPPQRPRWRRRLTAKRAGSAGGVACRKGAWPEAGPGFRASPRRQPISALPAHPSPWQPRGPAPSPSLPPPAFPLRLHGNRAPSPPRGPLPWRPRGSPLPPPASPWQPRSP